MATQRHTDRHYFCMCTAVNIAHISQKLSSLQSNTSLWGYSSDDEFNMLMVSLFLSTEKAKTAKLQGLYRHHHAYLD